MDHIPIYSSELNQTKNALFFGDVCLGTTKIKQDRLLLSSCQSVRYGILTQGMYMAMMRSHDLVFGKIYIHFIQSL